MNVFIFLWMSTTLVLIIFVLALRSYWKQMDTLKEENDRLVNVLRQRSNQLRLKSTEARHLEREVKRLRKEK